MYLSRVVIRNFRNLSHLDVPLASGVNCIIGENNSGKSNLLLAIRLCLDAGLSSNVRKLSPTDVYAGVDQTAPFQVLVGVELVDYANDVNQLALLHACQLEPDKARVFFRFRPKRMVREAIASGEHTGGSLQADDYAWEIMGGGDTDVDLASIEWNQDAGHPLSLADLQHFQVVTLHALRDVESDLRNSRASPLVKLLEVAEIPETERQAFVSTLAQANAAISSSPSLGETISGIQTSLGEATGPNYNFALNIGIGDPTYQSILRSLRVQLSEHGGIQSIDPSRNGLGLNNVLYISIWLEYLARRVAHESTAGQLILIEEPEAHLHPQLQMTLMAALERLSFQSLLTTHSTHVTSRLNIDSNVILSKRSSAIVGHAVSSNSSISFSERRDLERYLDSTKSTLLYARRVLLVEGAAELLLLPALIKELMEIDVEQHGISIISINGTHFAPFMKLFAGGDLGKRCAVVADGDRPPDELDDDGQSAHERRSDLRAQECDDVKIFLGHTTFERELAFLENAGMVVAATTDAGLSVAAGRLSLLAHEGEGFESDTPERAEIAGRFQDATLRVARRIGKGRFAQLCAKHVEQAYLLPEYISDAVDWLQEE